MTLEQLRMFVTVAELGSIASAAKVLHKTQPALSVAIKRLQEELQVSFNAPAQAECGKRKRIQIHPHVHNGHDTHGDKMRGRQYKNNHHSNGRGAIEQQQINGNNNNDSD